MQIRERLSLKISVQIFHKKFYTQTAEDSFTNKKTCTIENKCTYKEGSLSKVIELIGVFKVWVCHHFLLLISLNICLHCCVIAFYCV